MASSSTARSLTGYDLVKKRTVRFRCTEGEEAIIKRKAQRAHLTMSDYIRAKLELVQQVISDPEE